jgi:hypothetical protein
MSSEQEYGSYREAAPHEVVVRNWDIIRSFNGAFHVASASSNGMEWRISSPVFRAEIKDLVKLGPGSRIRVRSGKVYVLAGPRSAEGHPWSCWSFVAPSRPSLPWWKNLFGMFKRAV